MWPSASPSASGSGDDSRDSIDASRECSCLGWIGESAASGISVVVDTSSNLPIAEVSRKGARVTVQIKPQRLS